MSKSISLTPEYYRQWWKENTDVPYGYCWCGCGGATVLALAHYRSRRWVKGEPVRYARGHNSRTRLHSFGTKAKQCAHCKEVKPRAEFYSCKNTSDGLQTSCKQCGRELQRVFKRRNPEKPRLYHYSGRYGLSTSEYRAIWLAQDGKCALCGRPEKAKRNGKTKWLAVDHCHKSGKVRALLCTNCNGGLGMFGDDPELLQKAIEYLQR